MRLEMLEFHHIGKLNLRKKTEINFILFKRILNELKVNE